MKLKFKTAFLADFRKFILRGNVMDMAVGIIVGAAFGNIINSLVSDIMMPLLGLLTGSINFSNLFIPLGVGEFKTIAQAKEAGVATINYGSFITVIINFIIMSFAVFIIIKTANKLADLRTKTTQGGQQEDGPTLCPYCFMEININAKKCPYCTADLPVGWHDELVKS